MTWGVASLLLAMLIGLQVVRIFWPGCSRLCAWAMGLGVGVGTTSALYFTWSVVSSPQQPGYFAAELLVLVAIWIVRMVAGGRAEPLRRRDGKVLPGTIFVCLLIATVLSLLRFAGQSILQPHGQWDAWAIWNFHARFIARGGTSWWNLFDPKHAHPDYPLLLPFQVARGWLMSGDQRVIVPMLVAVSFWLATVLLLAGVVRALRGPALGWLAGIALAGLGTYATLAASQYADIPLSFYYLAATSLLVLWLTDAERSPWILILCGLITGMAAWTKNEGLAFALVVTLLVPAFAAYKDGWRGIWRVSLLLAGLLPVVTMVLWVKVVLAPANDLLTNSKWSDAVEHLTNLSRYGAIAAAMLKQMWENLAGVLIAFVLIVGANPDRKQRWAAALPFAVVLLVLAADFLALLLTPYDLQWHVTSTMPRLMAHVWPTLILGVFLLSASFPQQPATTSPAEARLLSVAEKE